MGLANASHVSTTGIATFDSIAAPGLATPLPLAPAGHGPPPATECRPVMEGNRQRHQLQHQARNHKRRPIREPRLRHHDGHIDETAPNGVTVITSSPRSTLRGKRDLAGSRRYPSSLFLPTGWVNQDIGAVGFAGGATYTAGTLHQGFRHGHLGHDGWIPLLLSNRIRRRDLVARATSMQNTSSYAKASVMFRASILANSSHVSMQVNPGGSVYFAYRAEAGATTPIRDGPEAACQGG